MSRLYSGSNKEHGDYRGSYTYVEYASISEYHDYMDKPGVSGRDSSSSSRDNGRWAGTETFEDAVSLMVKGDKESFDMVMSSKQKTDALFKDMKVDKAKMVNSVEGFQPIVANALLGLPNSMINVKKEPKSVKVIDIVYNSSIGAGTNVDDIRLRGAYLLSSIEQLEKNGYRVNLYASKINVTGSDITGHIVKIKDAMSPLNILKVAFYIINPAYLRRISFKIDEVEERIIDCTKNGYGAATSFDKVKDVMKGSFSNKDILIFDKSVDIWEDNSDENNIESIKEFLSGKITLFED